MKNKKTRFIACILSLVFLLPSVAAVAADGSVKGNTDKYVDSTELFDDIEPGAWYVDYVNFAVEKNFFSGTGYREFSPKATMTRAMLVQTLYNLESRPEIMEYPPFTDCPTDAWYAGAVTWAAANNIVSGMGNGKFMPDKIVTREEAASIIYRFVANYKHKDVSYLVDIDYFLDIDDVSSWAKTNLRWIVAVGLISGYDEDFGVFLRPKQGMIRAEFATVLTLYYKLIEHKILSTYYDSGNLGSMRYVFGEADAKATDIICYSGMNIEHYINGQVTYRFANSNCGYDKAGQDWVRSINPNAKILLALVGQFGSGGSDSYNTSFLEISRTEAICRSACKQIVDNMINWGFDGIDIDWEYPASEVHKPYTALLISTLRAELDARSRESGRKYLLTAAIPNGSWPFTLYDMDVFGKKLDYINLMSYDSYMYRGNTAHHTAPYGDSLSADGTVKIFTAKGIPAYKILIGCGLYSHSWKNVSNNGRYGLGARGTPEENVVMHYNRLGTFAGYGDNKIYWDDTCKAAFIYNGSTFISIDTDQSVYFKNTVSYQNHTGGLMFFCYSTYRGTPISTMVRGWLDWNLLYTGREWQYAGIIR